MLGFGGSWEDQKAGKRFRVLRMRKWDLQVRERVIILEREKKGWRGSESGLGGLGGFG